MAPTDTVITARIPTELAARLDGHTNEVRRRGHLIREAVELWCDSEDGEVEVEATESHTPAPAVDALRAELAELRARLATAPAARSGDADHVGPPTPTKRRKELWAALKAFQSRKIGGMTAAEVLGDREQTTGRRLPQNGVAKRVSELAAGGYITDRPELAADPDGAWATARSDTHMPATKDGQPTGSFTRVTPFGRAATVYWVTPAGVEHYNNPPKP